MAFSMSKDEFDRQIDFMYDEPDLILDKLKGHSDLHFGGTQSEHLNRLFTENIPGSCSFLDKETMDESIIESIVYKSDDIYSWLTSSKLDFQVKDKDRNFHTYSFSVNMGEPVGIGIRRSDMQEYKTSVIRIVLERDNSSTAPIGFFVKTAYPNIMDPKAELTGHHINKIDILKTDKLRSTLDRTFYILKNRFPNYDIRHKAATNRNPECIKVKIPSDVYGSIEIFLNEGMPERIASFNKCNGSRSISLADIFLNDEKNQADVLTIINIRDMVLQGHTFIEKDLDPNEKISYVNDR